MSKKSYRLRWIREKLKLNPVDVYKPLNIPRPTFYIWETKLVGCDVMRLASLVEFYNSLWQKKFIDSFPEYFKRSISKITIDFIIFGVDQNQTNVDKTIQILKENYDLKEKELLNKILNLKAELMKK